MISNVVKVQRELRYCTWSLKFLIHKRKGPNIYRLASAADTLLCESHTRLNEHVENLTLHWNASMKGFLS